MTRKETSWVWIEILDFIVIYFHIIFIKAVKENLFKNDP